ncbi:hypothetical protein [Kordia sp.]|uniref:hypothetical protein n=1 Tax=Kordia sp. TaxID=1965332 RepID=UPI003D6AF6FD
MSKIKVKRKKEEQRKKELKLFQKKVEKLHEENEKECEELKKVGVQSPLFLVQILASVAQYQDKYNIFKTGSFYKNYR